MNPPNSHPALKGVFFGFLGVLCFSLTLPATRVAVTSLDVTVVGLGRALVAAVFAGVTLLIFRQPWPSRAQSKSLMLVAFGVVFGFPFFSTWAMQHVPASHGAILLGVLPLATALVSRLRAHERPSPWFWVASAVGSLAVIAFALRSGGGSLQIADLALLLAVVLAALGYAEGGRLAREMGGWQVICWSLLLAAPFLVWPVAYAAWSHGLYATPLAWLGFAYVSLFSMFLGFFAWYHGLALGGVAKISQLQLLQPFLTLGFSAWLLNEIIDLFALIAAALVVVSILFSRHTSVVSISPSDPKA